MKKLLITGSIIAAIFFSGCLAKYDMAEEPSKLKGMPIETFFEKMKKDKDDKNKYRAEIIYLDSKEESFAYNGILLSKYYCETNIGNFKELSLGYKDSHFNFYKGMSYKHYVCEIDNNPLFFITSTDHYTYSDFDRHRAFIDISQKSKNDYKLLVEDREKQKEALKLAEKKKKEKELKEEIEFNKKVKLLKNRKGTIEAVFYDNFNYKYGKDNCNKSCNRLTLDNSGYESLQQALDDKWQFVSYVGDVKNDVDSSCSCNGKKVILKK